MNRLVNVLEKAGLFRAPTEAEKTGESAMGLDLLWCAGVVHSSRKSAVEHQVCDALRTLHRIGNGDRATS